MITNPYINELVRRHKQQQNKQQEQEQEQQHDKQDFDLVSCELRNSQKTRTTKK